MDQRQSNVCDCSSKHSPNCFEKLDVEVYPSTNSSIYLNEEQQAVYVIINNVCLRSIKTSRNTKMIKENKSGGWLLMMLS